MKSYTVITSKETTTGLNWVIDAKAPLSAEDKELIKISLRSCIGLTQIVTTGHLMKSYRPGGGWRT